MKTSSFVFAWLFGLVLSGHAQSYYSIDWSKTSGGGGTSTNAQYCLTGTIGQPDASGTLTNGLYALSGGYWSVFAVETANAPILRITRTSTNTVMVSWPSSAAGFDLVQSADLASAIWMAPSESIQDDGTNKFILVTPPTGIRFYRLRKP